MSDGAIIETLRGYFPSHAQGLVAAYLFGSLARDRGGEKSDIDIGLLYRDPPPPSISGPAARVEDDLERQLRRTVQAIVLNPARKMRPAGA